MVVALVLEVEPCVEVVLTDVVEAYVVEPRSMVREFPEDREVHPVTVIPADM